MLAPSESNSNQPIAVLGAGTLVSHLSRIGGNDASVSYKFNIFRLEENAEVTHSLRPSDLPDMLKLCHVLAFAIVDDGWVADGQRIELLDLIAKLEAITDEWDLQHG